MERYAVCIFLTTVSLLPMTSCEHRFPVPDAENEVNADYWLEENWHQLQERVSTPRNTKKARNVILFLGDGMGITTVTASRIYKGQRSGNSGEEDSLVFENFPHLALAKTYNLDKQTPDSAATATAYLCGSKANFGTLGVTGNVKRKQCDKAAFKEHHAHSIMLWAQRTGRWTGIVTTSSVTDATPAASYAHSADRAYQAFVPKHCKTPDIAAQLMSSAPGNNFRVIFGGGRQNFIPDTNGGKRRDNRNLIREWLSYRMARNETAAFFIDRKQMQHVRKNPNVSHMLGLFAEDNMPYAFHGSTQDLPTLEEMTETAIDLLQRSPKGFVLLVEGALIDKAHHQNKPALSLEETYHFDRAVNVAVRKLLPRNDTLLVVTADHSHAFTVGGYPLRGNDILGSAGTDVQGRTYPTLNYAAGPGYEALKSGAMPNTSPYLATATFYTTSGIHGGEDVAIYAAGPWSHLYSGVVDQSYIPQVMYHAACMGPFIEQAKQPPAHCHRNRDDSSSNSD